MASRKIQKILIANRGEIAVRVMRTCREMGIATVAVFSDADANAMHVRYADEAVHIGEPPAVASYLSGEKILDAAAQTGADAIHPGYGFLAENAAFAEACANRDVVFIGPPPEAIRSMGDKTAARKLMAEAGVPMAPGTESDLGVAAATTAAAGIGYPVLIKAAAGGGGKGMRVVEEEADFERSFLAAQSEAKSAFGDGSVFVEKFISEPRHIEFQILADGHGNAIHLFERECSIQRRHQKVIEEAPSSVLDDALREEMGRAAVAAAKACGYVNAGTVEFLVDASGSFYFMEMNTRLQVEHPVTEEITGLDLVELQIHIAEGQPIPFRQEELSINGHAIECRVYAEDPSSGFLPDPGTLAVHVPPAGPGVRLDAGVEESDTIPIHYDPMIAKLVCWGRNREQAIRRTARALSDYRVAGVRTTIPFCAFVVDHDAFRAGQYSTRFVEKYYNPGETNHVDSETATDAALLATIYHARSNGVADVNTKVEQVGNGKSWLRRRKYR